MTPGEDEKSGIVLAHAARIPVVGFVIVLFLNAGFLVFVGFFIILFLNAPSLLGWRIKGGAAARRNYDLLI